MNRNSGRGRAYISYLAILMIACVVPAAYSQQSTRIAASLPKYSRDWTAVVQKMALALDANRMMKMASGLV